MEDRQRWAGTRECLSQGSQDSGLGEKVLEPGQGFIVYFTAAACLLGQLEPPGETGPRSLWLQTLGPSTQEAKARVLGQLELYSKPCFKMNESINEHTNKHWTLSVTSGTEGPE